MGLVEKTVFISYRRSNNWTALAVYKDLTTNGFDVFMDYKSIGSGDFEKVIFENIRARAHFLVLLSPTALDRCGDANDLMRREIEMALHEGRNVVPLMMQGFEFSSSAVARVLTGDLASLKKCNGLPVFAEYFDAAMERLRTQFLNVALQDISLHTLSNETRELVRADQVAISATPPIQVDQLVRQEEVELSSLHIRIPILGRISSGEPILVPATDFPYFGAAETIEVETRLLPQRDRKKQLFALEVRGDGMIDAMVNDRDIVVLYPTGSARNGDMVAIWLPDKNEATLKYFYNEGADIRLQPANPAMKPILLRKGAPFEVKGKVVMVIRKVPNES